MGDKTGVPMQTRSQCQNCSHSDKNTKSSMGLVGLVLILEGEVCIKGPLESYHWTLLIKLTIGNNWLDSSTKPATAT